MEDQYHTISENSVGEGYYTEKRSKFLAFAHHVETVEEVKSIVSAYRKQYYDARHCCYAYMLGPEQKLTDILIVVVRYYGGVNLGTGGLIVAYRTAAADAIANATIEVRQVEETIKYDFTYPMMNDVMRIVKEMQPQVVDQQFDNTCSITLRIRKREAEQLRSRLNKLSFE